MKKIVLFVLVICIAISLASCDVARTQQQALENWVNVSLNCNEKNVKKCAPKQFWEYLKDEYNVTPKDVAEVLLEFNDEKFVECRFDIINSQSVDKDRYIEGLYKFGINEDDIQEVASIEYKYTTKEEGGNEETGSCAEPFVKINNNWYAIEMIDGCYDAAIHIYETDTIK